MVYAYIVIGLVAAAALFYLFALYPGRCRRDGLSPFLGKKVAHRGLFSGDDIPENSLRAFWAAAESGYPIELDVQLTADGELVVFHDETLKRMCNVDKKVIDCTYNELCDLRLGKSAQGIPKFSEVLGLVAGKVPLLIEVKQYNDCVATAKTLSKELRGYKGEYAVQSFHPMVVAWFRKNEPNIARGLLATVPKSKKKNAVSFFHKVFSSTLLLNFYSRPDFISFNHKYADSFPYRLARKLYSFENAAWTLKTQKELERAKKIFNIYIFDSFIPR